MRQNFKLSNCNNLKKNIFNVLSAYLQYKEEEIDRNKIATLPLIVYKIWDILFRMDSLSFLALSPPDRFYAYLTFRADCV